MTTKQENEQQKVEEKNSSNSKANNEETLELLAHCLCGAQRFTAAVPTSSLPLKASYCHCNSCRRMSGSLYNTYISWPSDDKNVAVSRESSSTPFTPPTSSSPSSPTPLREYMFADRVAILFCGVCGSTMFAETKWAAGHTDNASRRSELGVQSGVLANRAEIPVDIVHHIFVGDTLDGGAVPWLCEANSEGADAPKLWMGHSVQSEELSLETVKEWHNKSSRSSSSGHDNNNSSSDDHNSPGKGDVPIRCRCGGVDLVLHESAARADYASQPRSELSVFVDPVTNKTLASFDACDSCRLSAGTDIFHWTFVNIHHLDFASTTTTTSDENQTPATKFPSSSIELKDAITSAEADRDPRLGTLTLYQSSPDVQRYFCSRCSACIFYACDDRPEVLDLAIGVLRSPDGTARAEELLSWNFGGKMSFQEDAAGGWREGFMEKVRVTADRWRDARGYPKNWRRAQEEGEKEVLV